MGREKALQTLVKGCFIPATPLCLDKYRRFDSVAQKKLTRYYLESGVDGVATAVHTTQFQIRDKGVDLFETVLKTVSEEITAYEAQTGKTVVKVAGACGPVAQAVSEARLAKEYGFDAVLLSPGGLASLTEEQLLERAAAVAEVIPVIGFYLQLSVGGRRLSYDFWKSFCTIKGVRAIKCASFDRYSTADVMRAAALSERRNEIGLFTGNDDNIVVDLLTPYRFTSGGTAYEARFTGGLLGHWSVWTKTAVDYYHTLREATLKDSLDPSLLTLAAEITDANSAVFDTRNGFKGCIAGVHEVLRRQGRMNNILCLNPEETLSEGQSAEIDRVYAMYPHLYKFDK